MNSRRILHNAFRIFVLTMLILVTFQVPTVSAKDLLKDKPKHTAKAILKNTETNEKIELPVEIVENETDEGGLSPIPSMLLYP